MVDCHGPLGGICAFLGGVGLPLAVWGFIFAVLEKLDHPKAKSDESLSPLLIITLVGEGMLIVCIILAFVNQSLLPVSCLHR